ncbi:ferric reductase like transmembrane component-domain-containing protein [Absidia repens]|uniref:Ferric reductase like transmembrane component-domain-containing protein n=1 Tax=Absidia repens TaxID=90262 RepID=A0A1X2IKH5_9FUNG|nr:ferric reductase like transmembrane component-domain-containing protein [Absidia repens]
MKQFFFLVLFLLASCTFAREQSAPLASACRTLSEKYIFSNCTKRVYAAPECQCNDQPWLGSMALCVSDNGDNDHGKEKEWDYVKSAICKAVPDSTAFTVSMQDILANATKFVVPLPANATTDRLFAPIRFPRTEIGNIMRTVAEFNNQLQYGLNYGGACSALVLVFVVFGMLNNLFHHCVSWRYKSAVKPKALPSSPSWIRFIRRHIVNPSLFFDGVHLQSASWFGVRVSYPTRFESIFIFLYVVMNIFILFPSYDLFLENTYWPQDIPAQLGRYIADRSGEMSFAQLPMVYLFGGRNNILIWLTGWSYDRFIIAHKWASRMMMLHAIIHSAAYTWVGLHYDFETYVSYYEGLYFRWGVAATVLGSFTLLFALPNLRRKCYDLFLYTHIVFVVLFTVACWYHVALLEDEQNMPFLYASIAVWSFDRVARFARVVYYNIMLLTGRRSLRSVKADIIPGTDCIRFRVDANKYGLSHRIPGAFVYIYVPKAYFWQSHPFTIASWNQPSLDKRTPVPIDTVNATDPSETSNKKPTLSSPDSAIKISDTDSASSSTTTTTTTAGNTFDLLIRPQKGMTKKLYEAVEKLGPDGGDMYVLVEGPYGHSHPVLQYDTAILVGGGVGCTATVPYLQEAVYNASKNATRHLVFVWVVQHDDQLNWAQQDIEDCLSHINVKKTQETSTGNEDLAANTSLTLDVFIYATRSTKSNDVKKEKDQQQQEGLTLSYGVRPDLDKLLGQYIESAQGSVAILHCGPARMSDQIRQISAHHGVAYLEEAFEW